MNTEKFYRASEIISYPEIEAIAPNPDKGIKGKRYRPERHGLLPFSETHFYRLLKAGKFPQPDGKAGDTKLWSGKLLYSYLTKHSH